MLRTFALACIFISGTFAIPGKQAGTKVNYLDYRNIATCEGRPHTFWIYRSTDAAKACSNVMQVGLKPVEKKKILDYHNKLRRKVARGEETRGNPGPQPAASHMPELEWDDLLADLAQRWALQCNFEHDQCRDVEQFKVNQMYVRYDIDGDVSSYSVENMIDGWYEDVDTFDAKMVSNISTTASNYPQIVWAETTKIGCGGMKYPVPGKNRFLLVCNYGPAGNIFGESVYKTC